MRAIQLGQIGNLFEDGISHGNYQRLSRLINTLGSAAKVTIDFTGKEESDHEALTKLLRRVEDGKAKVSYW